MTIPAGGTEQATRWPARPPAPRGCPEPLARAYDLAILDLDGVVYIGPAAVPGAAAALRTARTMGLQVCFVTNNASRPVGTVAAHLTELGIPTSTADVVTSAQVAAAMLARRLPAGAAVLIVGGAGLEESLTEQGLRPVRSAAEGPQAVVQGFSPDLGWRALAEGTRAVRSGVFWVATNLDLTVPTPHGPAPGNGSLVAVIATAAQRQPDAVAGKPEPGAFLEAARRYGSTRPLVVGDRLDTDLEGARAADQDGLLVLTGVSGARELLSCPVHRRPTYVGRDLAALHHPHPAVDVRDGWARCREAEVVADPSGLTVTSCGLDALDVLRAAAAFRCSRSRPRPAGRGGRCAMPVRSARSSPTRSCRLARRGRRREPRARADRALAAAGGAGRWSGRPRPRWAGSRPGCCPRPAPRQSHFWDTLRSGALLHHVWVSTQRALIGLAIGGGLGFALGLLNGVFPFAERLLDSSLQMLRNIPHLAAIPLVILWFGIDEEAKLFLVAAGVLFPIYLNTFHGIRHVDRALIEMARSYGLGPWALFSRVILPGCTAVGPGRAALRAWASCG